MYITINNCIIQQIRRFKFYEPKICHIKLIIFEKNSHSSPQFSKIVKSGGTSPWLWMTCTALGLIHAGCACVIQKSQKLATRCQKLDFRPK